MPKAQTTKSKHAVKMAQQVQQSKKDVLVALEKSLGIVTTACQKVGIDRTTFYRYVNEDPQFAESVKAIDDVALDFAESSLHKQIQAGVPASTIFYLKTKGKRRDYIERSEVTGKDGGALETKIVVEYLDDGK